MIAHIDIHVEYIHLIWKVLGLLPFDMTNLAKMVPTLNGLL
jgi:hypothetical protein